MICPFEFILAIFLNKRPNLAHFALWEPEISYRAKCLEFYCYKHFFPKILIIVMYFVTVQYKNILTRGPSVPKYLTGAQISANNCNKETDGEWLGVVLVNFTALKWNILIFKGDDKINVVALNRHDRETGSPKLDITKFYHRGSVPARKWKGQGAR